VRHLTHQSGHTNLWLAWGPGGGGEEGGGPNICFSPRTSPGT
jgi:hypothetical protein